MSSCQVSYNRSFYKQLLLYPGIVIISDGIVGCPEAALFDSLMSQLRHSTIECSFIQTGGGGSSTHSTGTDAGCAGLGQVVFHELMQFIAMATFGAYITKLPDLVRRIVKEFIETVTC